MDVISTYEAQLYSVHGAEVIIYFFIGLLTKFMIRTAGPLVLRGKYLKEITSYTLNEESQINIFYRILSPVVYSYLIIGVVYILSSPFNFKGPRNLMWLPVVFYWCIQIVTVFRARHVRYPKWTLFAQAFLSIGVGIYFDWVVVREIPTRGIGWFEQTNIGWQFMLVFFFGVSGLILSGFVKGNGQREHANDTTNDEDDSDAPPKLYFSSSQEEKFYSYKRRFHHLLPDVFNEDPLLLSLFYSIVYIEDANRPAWHRALERALFFTNRVRSTGIMQLRSPVYLTDEDSVIKAAPFVQSIWFDFLEDIGKERHSPLELCPRGYSYRFPDLLKFFIAQSNVLYGRYCGTMTYDVSETFAAMSGLVIYSESFFTPSSVRVRSKAFSTYTELFSNHQLEFMNGAIRNLDNYPQDHTSEVVLRTYSEPPIEEVKEVLRFLERTGCVIHRVIPASPLYWEISVHPPTMPIFDELRGKFKNWQIVATHSYQTDETNLCP